MSTDRQPAKRTRRGIVIAVALLVVMVLGLAVAGAIQPLSQESDLASLRVETVRAFYAAESGVVVHLAALNAGTPAPESGHMTTLGTSSFSYIEAGGPGGILTVEGRSGSAKRRVTLAVE
jgi:Tfp pilus assembly protein PilX